MPELLGGCFEAGQQVWSHWSSTRDTSCIEDEYSRTQDVSIIIIVLVSLNQSLFYENLYSYLCIMALENNFLYLPTPVHGS